MLSSTKKIILFLGSMLALALCVYVAMWYVVSLREEAIRTDVAEQREEYSRRENASALALVFDDTVAERAELHEYIVSKDGVTTFLELVEQVGREQGLVVDTKSVTPEVLSGEEAFESLVVTIALEGSYEGIKTMLALMESLPLQTHIQAVSLTRGSGDSTWLGTLTMKVTKEK